MYGVVLLMAVTVGGETADFGRRGSCYGCYGCHGCYGCYGGCSGCWGGCHGCYGGWSKHRWHGCGGCYGGCYGGCISVPVYSCAGYVPTYGHGCGGVIHHGGHGYGGCAGVIHGGIVHDGGVIISGGGHDGHSHGGVAGSNGNKPKVEEEDKDKGKKGKDEKDKKDDKKGKDKKDDDLVSRKTRNTSNDASNEASAEEAPARLIVQLPADARLLVDGKATRSQSAERVFVTPNLPMSKEYTYTLTVEVTKDGKPTSWKKMVKVRGGETTRVSLLKAEDVVQR